MHLVKTSDDGRRAFRTEVDEGNNKNAVPLTAQFLALLARDIAQFPEKITAVEPELIERISRLVEGVEVDPDESLTKKLEAVMSNESLEPRPARRPARKSGKADRTQGDELTLTNPLSGSVPSAMRETEKDEVLKIARKVMKDRGEALHEFAA